MNKNKSFFESRNPVLNDRMFQKTAYQKFNGGISRAADERMTVQGAVNKTLLLSAILLATAVYGFSVANPALMIGGGIVGLVIVIVSSFKPAWSPILAPVYAAVEGLFLGSISYLYAGFMDGIILHAASLTVAILFIMLFVYKAGIIKVNDKFRSGVIMATGAIFLVYLMSFILSFFGIQIPYLHEGGIIGIGISLLIIGIASLNLLLDFDNFEKGEQYGAPAYMEWFSAMGLLITLVWLYIEILRLLAMFSRND